MDIAILEPNILTAMGLQDLFEEIIPTVNVRVFRRFIDFTDDTPDAYTFCFISAQIYFEHTQFFLDRRRKSIILCNGDSLPHLSGMMTLNMYQDQHGLVRQLLQLHQTGHPSPHQTKKRLSASVDAEHELTAREIEVLIYLTKGLINKEIADKMNISLTTVISHRKRITEKTGIKSASGLAIYAVMQGYIEANQV